MRDASRAPIEGTNSLPRHGSRAILAAVLLAATATCALAQDGLRGTGTDDIGGFPTSADTAPILTPERNTPPAITGGTSDADDLSTSSSTQNQPDPGAPNYGKPRKVKGKLYRPSPKTAIPLSPLVPYRTSQRILRPTLRPQPAQGPQASTSISPVNAPVDAVGPGPTVAAIGFPALRNRPPIEPDSFLPTGIQVGELRLLPFAEASTGFQSNPNQVQVGVKPSTELRVDTGVAVQSDFSNHSLSGALRGGYSLFPQNTKANRPDVSLLVDGRLDVTRDDQINGETRLVVVTQTPGSPLLAVPNSAFITNRPLIVSEGATLGAAHRFNRLVLDLRGTFDRTQYGDASQSDGTTFFYSQQNYNDYGVLARASYDVTPGIIPFVEAGYDSRVRDQTVDQAGFRRDSKGLLARVGSSFEMFGHFTGTLSAGYAERRYADPRLPNLRGPTFDGSLIYAFSPLTTVTLRAATTLSETTLAGASGAISRLVSLEIGHVFFRNFTVSGIATYQPNQYQGVSVQEAFSQFTLKAAYSFTRDVQLIASASQQNLRSSLLGSGFRDTILLVGVRLQR